MLTLLLKLSLERETSLGILSPTTPPPALDHALLCSPCSVLNMSSNCLSFPERLMHGLFSSCCCKGGWHVLMHLRDGSWHRAKVRGVWLLLFTLISTCWLLSIAKVIYVAQLEKTLKNFHWKIWKWLVISPPRHDLAFHCKSCQAFLCKWKLKT